MATLFFLSIPAAFCYGEIFDMFLQGGGYETEKIPIATMIFPFCFLLIGIFILWSGKKSQKTVNIEDESLN